MRNRSCHLLLSLLVGLSSCIPGWDKCGSNDFTCNTRMQLFAFLPGSAVVVGGSQGAIPAYVVSLDDGTTWSTSTLSSSGGSSLSTMNFADGRFLAGISSPSFYETRDSGRTWNLISTSAATTGAVGHFDGKYLVHDTTGGSVFTMPDGGSSWTTQTGIMYGTSLNIFSAGGQVYLLISFGTPALYYYSGAAWQTVSGISGAVTSMCMQNGRIYVADITQLYSATAGSASFAVQGTMPAGGPNPGNMACNGSTFVVPFSAICQVAASQDGGNSWTTVNLGCGANSVLGVAFTGRRYVAAVSNGAIYVSDDGLTWSQSTLPAGSYTWSSIAANPAASYY